MPTNKNAQLRYQVLDRCFGDKERLYSLEELLDCVNDKMAEMVCNICPTSLLDQTMLRIGAMNLMLHGVDNPDIKYQAVFRPTTPTATAIRSSSSRLTTSEPTTTTFR